MKAEAIGETLQAERQKLLALEERQKAAEAKRMALQNERPALYVREDDGDTSATARLKIINKNEIPAAEDEEARAKALAAKCKDRIAALEISLRQAERALLRSKRTEIDGRLREQGEKIDSALDLLVSAISEHSATFAERNRISQQLADCRALTARNATRTVAAIVSDVGSYGAVRTGRPFRTAYVDVLKRMLSGTQSADDDAQDLAVNA